MKTYHQPNKPTKSRMKKLLIKEQFQQKIKKIYCNNNITTSICYRYYRYIERAALLERTRNLVSYITFVFNVFSRYGICVIIL